MTLDANGHKPFNTNHLRQVLICRKNHFFLDFDDELRPVEALFQAHVFLAKLFELGQQRIRLTWLAPSLYRLETVHPFYLKWLRYYLDFCERYQFSHAQASSLPHFLRKLQEKKQSPVQQHQARHAIMLYYELFQSPEP